MPSGPVAAAYEVCEALNPLIIGPVGSGKTTVSVRKIARLAHRVPGQVDTVHGAKAVVKRCRVAVVAMDYRILWKNVMPSYWKVFPKEWGVWVGGTGEPAVHKFQMWSGSDPTSGLRVCLDIQVDFLGVGDKSLDEIVRGLELTGAYVYEWDTLPQATIAKFASRLGRYPNMGSGDLQDTVPRQIWGDCNAFDVEHWAFAECFENKPPGREVFVQPGARTPKAENIQFVGRRYYDELISILKPWEVERLVDMKFVPDREGATVYPDFNPDHHLSDLVTFEPSLPLAIGVDGGLDAAAAICQRVGRKRWRVLDEVVTPEGDTVVAKQFGLRLADHLAQNYPGVPVVAFADPSTENKNSVDVRVWLSQFAEGFGMPVRAAVSNVLKGRSGRIAAVQDVLTTYERGQFGLQVGPQARTIRRGFTGGYRWKVVKGKRTGEIEKAHCSHVHDALQYVIQSVEQQPSLLSEATPARGWASAADPPAMQVLM